MIDEHEIDPKAHPPRFLFNFGQWFGSAGVLTRDDFAHFLFKPTTTQLNKDTLAMNPLNKFVFL
jgi:hypothetical protein